MPLVTAALTKNSYSSVHARSCVAQGCLGI
jgi:hypothetical protein